MNNNVLIKIRGLSTTFKDDKSKNKIHDNLNLDIFDGEILSIIGRNGSGKTTLINTLLNVNKSQRLTEGDIDVDGDLIKFNTGVQFQVEDKISDIIKTKNIIKFYEKFYEDKVVKEKLEEMIDVFGVRDFMHMKLSKLSGGQRQRVNLLLATMHQPKLLILDEFTTGLDISSVMQILDYVLNMVKTNGSTLIIVTHQSKEIKMMADRVVHIKNGKIAGEYMKSDIINEYNNDFDDFLFKTINGE